MDSYRFDALLEQVESLSEEAWVELVTIVNQRRSQQRRTAIAQTIHQAKSDYQQGLVFRGSAEVVIEELFT